MSLHRVLWRFMTSGLTMRSSDDWIINIGPPDAKANKVNGSILPHNHNVICRCLVWRNSLHHKLENAKELPAKLILIVKVFQYCHYSVIFSKHQQNDNSKHCQSWPTSLKSCFFFGKVDPGKSLHMILVQIQVRIIYIYNIYICVCVSLYKHEGV